MTISRPNLSDDPNWTRAARDAVDDFVREPQASIDASDAERFNRHFSEDVAWGSPYGATVVGYNTLRSIHRRMFEHPVVGPSRYRTVYVSAPAPEVAIAQVRRDALDADGKPVPIDDPSTFSEMALYVLVRRDGRWWLAAGQNTPIRPKP